MNTSATLHSTSGLLPVAENNRIFTLDVLRGVAILGILIMNIPEFSMPRRYSEAFRNDPHTVDFWIRAFVLIFWEGKMRALFSLLFGAGILLFISNKSTSLHGVNFLFYRRMFWLIVFGLIDAHLLLWEGDVLYIYGIAGMIAYLFRKVNAKYLVLAVPLVAILEFAVQTIFYRDIREKRIAYVEAQSGLRNGNDTTALQKQQLEAWRNIELTMIPNEQDIVETNRILKSDYSAIAKKVREQSFMLQTQFLLYMLWDPLALMLLGMGLFKSGFLSGGWTKRRYKQMAVAGYAVGLPFVVSDICYTFLYAPDLAASLSLMVRDPIPWINVLYPIQRIAIMLAHTSLIILFVQSGWFRHLLHALQTTGQMALTNYVMQTVICTLVFFGYGLNQFGEWSYHQLFLLVGGIWVLQLRYSTVWLHYFQFGPLEWLWRSLTYWKIQPIKKPAT